MKKLFVALAVLAALFAALPVAAAEAPGHTTTIGGRIKADMGWQVLSHNQWGNKSNERIANFFATVNIKSYLRTMLTSSDKTAGAHIELALASISNQDNNGSAAAEIVSVCFAYGWWKLGACKFLAGQFAGRLGDRILPGNSLGHSKSGKSDLMGFGFIGGTRNPKVGLQVDISENLSFELAIGQAGAETPGFGMYNSTLAGNAATNSYLPRLEFVLDIKNGGLIITPGFGLSYQNAELGQLHAGVDSHVLSYLLQLPLQYQNGPFTIMLNAFYGQNTDTDWTGEQSTNWNSSFFPTSGRHYGGQPGVLPMIKGGSVEDTGYWGLGLGLAYNFTEALALKAGAGFANLSNPAWQVGGNCNDNYTRMGAFVSFPYKISSNFTIAPEVAYYNYGDIVGKNFAPNDQGKAGDEWLVGAHFQFVF